MVEEIGYSALFEQYIAAGVTHSLQAVEGDRYAVPEDVREQAWHLLSFALRTPRAWPVTANLLLALSPKMQQAGYREQWLAYLEQGLACSQAVGDHQSTAALQLEAGELLRHLGRLGEAGDYFRQAMHTFESSGDVLQTAAAKVCLANLAFLREEWSPALMLCQEALDAVPEVHYVRARALFVAANVHTSRHEYQQADESYSESHSVWAALGARQWVALCLQNQAWLAAERADYTPARNSYSEALATFKELNIPHSEAIVETDWGIIEFLAGNLESALVHYEKAESIFRHLNDVRSLAMVCNNIGMTYRSSREWEKAEQYYEESIRLWRQLGATLARISVEIGRGKLWLDRGDAGAALGFFRQILAELRQTERDAEHRRLYAEILEYSRQASLALGLPELERIDLEL